MQKATDWLELWRELAQLQSGAWKKAASPGPEGDAWRDRARGYDANVKRRWATPDSSRGFVVARLQANPDWTALDVGGGTGAWAVLMAQHARRVTVVEPSPAMIEVMQENIAAAGVHNVEIVRGRWPDVQVEPHDLTFCAHAMYGFQDFAAFVRSIEAVTRRLCVLVMRAPIPGGVMATAAMRAWGQPYDSPDFQVAYNALLQMGTFANVLMEDSGLWEPWSSPSLEDAYAELVRKLNLPEDGEHSAFLRDLLSRHLTYRDGQYLWHSLRSGLLEHRAEMTERS